MIAGFSELATFAAVMRALVPAHVHHGFGDALFAHGDRRLQRNGRAEPQTDDPWQPLACGERVAIRDGRISTGDSITSAAAGAACADHAV